MGCLPKSNGSGSDRQFCSILERQSHLRTRMVRNNIGNPGRILSGQDPDLVPAGEARFSPRPSLFLVGLGVWFGDEDHGPRPFRQLFTQADADARDVFGGRVPPAARHSFWGVAISWESFLSLLQPVPRSSGVGGCWVEAGAGGRVRSGARLPISLELCRTGSGGVAGSCTAQRSAGGGVGASGRRLSGSAVQRNG